MTVTIMKKQINLKTRMEIFKNMVGNIPGWNFLDGKFLSGNFPEGSLMGGSFSDTGSRYGKKHFVKILKCLVTVLFKMTLDLCIYFAFTKNPIILSLFKFDPFNFTMYISTSLTCTLMIAIKDHSFSS